MSSELSAKHAKSMTREMKSYANKLVDAVHDLKSLLKGEMKNFDVHKSNFTKSFDLTSKVMLVSRTFIFYHFL